MIAGCSPFASWLTTARNTGNGEKNISSGKPDIFTSGIWIYLEDRICIYVCGRGAHIKTVVCIHVRQHCAHYYLKSNQKNCQTEIKIKMNFFLCQRRDFILFHQAENAPYGKGCSCQAKTDRQYMKRSFQPCHWKRKKFHNGKKRQISCKKCFPYAPCLFFSLKNGTPAKAGITTSQNIASPPFMIIPILFLQPVFQHSHGDLFRCCRKFPYSYACGVIDCLRDRRTGRIDHQLANRFSAERP